MRDFRSFDTYLFDQNDTTTQGLFTDTNKPLVDGMLTPQMFSFYDRYRMPLEALKLLEELHPDLRYIDLTPDELA